MKKKNSYQIIRERLETAREILAANETAAATGDPCAMSAGELAALRSDIEYLADRIGGDPR